MELPAPDGERSGPALPSPPAQKAQNAPPSPEALRDLTRAIRRGDAAAFARFYDLYSFRIYRYLLVLAGGNENEAQEVCQCVLIKIARRFEVFTEPSQLWAWLRTLARNAYIDHCRARHRRGWLVCLGELPGVAEPNEASECRLQALLDEAMAQLPPEHRELLLAAYVDKRPLRELADETRQSYKALECRLARLRRQVKDNLLKALRHESQS